jgi:Sulfotransferase domain
VPAAERPAGDARTAADPADPADEAMVARARERFAGERRRLDRRKRRAAREGALPNLVVIGGLKCGTTSLHHYLALHPEIAMSRPKELNFFVAELNWDLGPEWYASHFDRAAPVRGETSPHYTNLPRFQGVAERMRATLTGDARIVCMVRDPIERILSHYIHNLGGGYETRALEDAVADPDASYVARSRYAMQLAPYLAAFERERILIVANEDLASEREATVRSVFEFCGVDTGFTSEQFERAWETGSARATEGGFRLMDRAVRLPGLRVLDRNFDRLPESLRWVVERVVHDPGKGAAPKPAVPEHVRRRLEEALRPDVAALERIAERRFGWFAETADA